MTNVAHNGFECPYCRTAMAEEPEDDEDTESTISYEDDEEEPLYDDYALRGLRFMTNNLEGVEHDILDLHDEREDEEQQDTEADEDPKPTASFVTNKLIEQGVTMEQLVKCLLINHDEYQNEDELDRIENDIFGKMRIIISNFRPEEQDQPASPVPRPVEPVSAPLPPPIAEPKTPTTNSVVRSCISVVA